MNDAVVGLIGVGLGGALTALVEERRAWASRRQDAARDARDIRQAARLVENEFFEAELAVGQGVSERDWWDDTAIKLSTEQWDRAAALLAGSDLSEEDWNVLASAASAVNEVIQLRHRRDRDGGEPPTMLDYSRLVGAASAMSEGANVLRALRGVRQYRPYEPPEWYEKIRLAYVKKVEEAVAQGEPAPPFG